MIKDKESLAHYLHEDYKAIAYRKYCPPNSFIARFMSFPYAYWWQYLKNLRKAEYLYNSKPILWKIRYSFHSYRMRVLAMKLGGIEIPINTLGYGTRFFHYGKVIINKDATVGNYCTLYPGVCIGKKNGMVPKIGNNVFIGLGCYILGDVVIPDNSIIVPNAVVVKCPEKQAVLMGGVPAKVIKYL